jgi:hypothetical protein
MKWLFFVAMPFVFVVCSDQQAGLVSDDLIPARIADVIDYGDDGVAVAAQGPGFAAGVDCYRSLRGMGVNGGDAGWGFSAAAFV